MLVLYQMQHTVYCKYRSKRILGNLSFKDFLDAFYNFGFLEDNAFSVSLKNDMVALA